MLQNCNNGGIHDIINIITYINKYKITMDFVTWFSLRFFHSSIPEYKIYVSVGI